MITTPPFLSTSRGAMLWTVLWGWAFFGDLPTPATLAGAALIIASGIYAVTRPAPEPHSRR